MMNYHAVAVIVHCCMTFMETKVRGKCIDCKPHSLHLRLKSCCIPVKW